MTEIIQAGLFDYTRLDTETRIVVQQRTEEIKVLVRRSAQDIIDIGNKLIDVKARLGHGNFGPWLESEFGWTWKTATRFMDVAAKFDKLSNLENFGASALYLLAAPSTPEPARVEAIERAQSGEAITHATAKQIVAEHKPVNAVTKAPTVTRTPETDYDDYEEAGEEYAAEAEGYDWSSEELPDDEWMYSPIVRSKLGSYKQRGDLKRCEDCLHEWDDEALDCPQCYPPVATEPQTHPPVFTQKVPNWTSSQLERKEAAKRGITVHANMKTDEALIEWAKQEGIFFRVDRATEWGNPFHLPGDGDRETVINNYAWYLERKPSLLSKIHTLKGKVLGCWCYPESCHAEVLEERANA